MSLSGSDGLSGAGLLGGQGDLPCAPTVLSGTPASSGHRFSSQESRQPVCRLSASEPQTSPSGTEGAQSPKLKFPRQNR